MTWEGQGWSSAARDYHANREAAQGQELPFRFVLPRDITLQPKAFLIDGFVGAAETSAWYGPPDSGKSTVVLDAGCHVAAGLDYCGRQVTQGCVDAAFGHRSTPCYRDSCRHVLLSCWLRAGGRAASESSLPWVG